MNPELKALLLRTLSDLAMRYRQNMPQMAWTRDQLLRDVETCTAELQRVPDTQPSSTVTFS